MQKSIFPLVNGIGIYDNNRLCVCAVDDGGVKHVGGRDINPSHKFFDLPFFRGIHYFFKGVVLQILSLMLGRKLCEREGESNKSYRVAKNLTISSGFIALIATMLVSFLTGLMIYGYLSRLLTSKLLGSDAEYYLKSFMLALVRFVITYALLGLTKFVPSFSQLYAFNRVGSEEIAGKSGLKNATPLNFFNFVINVFLFSLFMVSLLAINIAWPINFLLNMIIFFASMSLVYEVLLLLSKTHGVARDISIAFSWLSFSKVNITQKEVLRVAVLEIGKSEFANEEQGRVNLSVLYAEMEGKLKESERYEESDVDWIVATILGKNRAEIKLIKSVSAKEYRDIMRATQRRAKGEPLSSIFGFVDFYGLKFEVNKKVLSPRMETEILVEEVIKKIRELELKSVLDLCTGSGAIGITIAKLTDVSVTCADISKQALAVAKTNAEKNSVKVDFVCSDLFKELKKRKKYDIIVSNPPYIKSADIQKLDDEVKKFDPKLALDGGEDGLEFYRRIAQGAPAHLNKKGWLFFEIGKGQADDVWQIMKDNGFTDIGQIKDYNKIERIVYGRISK